MPTPLPRLSDQARILYQHMTRAREPRTRLATFTANVAERISTSQSYKRDAEEALMLLITESIAHYVAATKKPMVLSEEERRALRDVFIVAAELAAAVSA